MSDVNTVASSIASTIRLAAAEFAGFELGESPLVFDTYSSQEFEDECFELYLAEAGTSRIQVHEQVTELAPGELLVVPRADRCRIVVTGSAGSGIRARLRGSLGLFSILAPLLPLSFILRLAELPGGSWVTESLRYSLDDSGALHPSAASILLGKLILFEVASGIVGQLPEHSKRSLWRGDDAGIIRLIVALQCAPGESWSLGRMAKLAAASTTSLNERFRRNVGASPVEYLRRLRMQHAFDQLRAGTNGITQVGLSVGYDSPAAFSRAFRRHFGMRPGDARRLASLDEERCFGHGDRSPGTASSHDF